MSRRSAAQHKPTTTYGPRLSVPVPTLLASALASAAGKSMTSMNSYVRAAVLAKLKADGFDPQGDRVCAARVRLRI
jgi:hypothetical protein